jgi:hypothetical protein
LADHHLEREGHARLELHRRAVSCTTKTVRRGRNLSVLAY